MSYRILHLADLHLERAFAGMGSNGEGSRRRRQGLRDALRRAGDVARARGCGAVTVGGDLYEHDRAGADTGNFLAETFAAWQPLLVALAPGNHDPMLPESLYARTEWPANVRVFQTPTLTPLELDDGLTLWGLGHEQPSWQGDPLAGPGPQSAGGVHLALFHGAEMGSRPAGKSVHGPFRAEHIHERGFTAALSGHYHRRRLDEGTGLLYPGTPEPLSYEDGGGRGPVIVEITPGGMIHFETLSLNTWSAVRIDCDLGGATGLTAVADRAIAATLAGTAGMDPERTIAGVELSGEVPCGLAPDVYSLESALRDATAMAAVRVRDMTRTDLDVATTAAERTARGSFARNTLAAIAETRGDAAEAAVLEDALRYGLQALSGVEVGLR
ncbi:MAG: exonuclease SbcCD subunit D [Candidatus Dormibacteria bacterium]